MNRNVFSKYGVLEIVISAYIDGHRIREKHIWWPRRLQAHHHGGAQERETIREGHKTTRRSRIGL